MEGLYRPVIIVMHCVGEFLELPGGHRQRMLKHDPGDAF